MMSYRIMIIDVLDLLSGVVYVTDLQYELEHRYNIRVSKEEVKSEVDSILSWENIEKVSDYKYKVY